MSETFERPLRKRIREFRKLRGLTQKELGDLCGVNESTIRNYELGNRYPDEEALANIADKLGVDIHALADPDPSTPAGALHMLFDLENDYGLSPKMIDGQVHLVLSDSSDKNADPEVQLQRLQFKEALSLWCHIREVCDKGTILDEEYEDWKLRYPDHIDTSETYGYEEDPSLQSEVRKLGRKVHQTRSAMSSASGDAENLDDSRKPKHKRKPRK